MRIVVVGAGAIGSLFGALLQRAGHDVTLVGRPEHVAAINRDGLTIEGRTTGTFSVRALSELPAGLETDLGLLTVKTFDLESAASVFGRTVRTPVPVVALENGLGVEATVEVALRSAGWSDPGQWIVRGINSVPATFARPGTVRHAGDGEVLLADYGAGRHADAVAQIFRAAGIPVRVDQDREREVWRKVLVNAAINPVTALHQIPNGRLRESPYREEATGLLREAQRAAAADGFEFSDAEADEAFERVVRATAENRSSMLQDRDRGRPTEVDAISGEIVRRARAHGVDLPRTRAVVERLAARPSRTEAT